MAGGFLDVNGLDMQKFGISSSMRSFKLTFAPSIPKPGFQVHRLGLHEMMRPSLVNRPEGTGDFLFMLFHSPVRVKSQEKISEWPSSSLIIWTPKDSHYYGNPDATWDHSWLHCSGREIAGLLRASRISPGRRIALSDPSLMERFLLEMAAELKGWSSPDGKILRNLFENFIRAVVRQVFDKTGPLAPPGLLAIKARIEQRFTGQVRLADLARQAGWSVPHLCTEFKRFFGLPIIQYIFQLRMNQATYLLRDHNRRVGEIALLVGYPDLYTFSKMFKRRFGVSPKKFREMNLAPQPGRR